MKTRPDSDSRVRAWFGRAFMLQVALISIAAVVGVFVASALLEGVLIRAALNDEVTSLLAAARRESRDSSCPTRATCAATSTTRRPPNCAPCRWATTTGTTGPRLRGQRHRT